MFSFILTVLLLTTVKTVSSDDAYEKGCPDAKIIEPCICTNGPHPLLWCQNIDDTESLRNVFLKTSTYQFKEVHLEYSVLQYLPHDMFQGVRILELHLRNVTLVQLFDDIPESLQMIEVLHIENTHVFRGMVWEHLQNLTNLRILNIYYNSIPVLGWEFSSVVPKSLQQISFYSTETEILKPGVLGDFENLDKAAFDDCGIKEISRSIFPRPSNIRFIYFNQNKLTSIPDDLFTEMPRLQTVGLRENQLQTLPALAFEGSFSSLQYLLLEGNPITCDCQIFWLLKPKSIPLHLTGKCESPLGLQGIELKDLSTKYINCLLP